MLPKTNKYYSMAKKPFLILIAGLLCLSAFGQKDVIIIDHGTDITIGKQSSGTGKIEKANKILSCSANDSGERLSIATQLDDGVTNARLVISSISGEPERTIPVSAQSPNVDENISSLQKGIHIVGLYVDNGLSDSKNWVKE